MDKYEAVIFDLDSTLTDTKKYPTIATQWLFEQMGIRHQNDISTCVDYLVKFYFEQIESIANGSPYKRPAEVVRSALQRAVERSGFKVDDDLLTETVNLFRKYHLELSEPMPRVSDLLSSLRKRSMKLAVITNAFLNHLPQILARLKLMQYFDVLVDSEVVETYKPNLAIFLHTARIMAVSPSRTLVVGDEYYADVIGAHNAGMDAVWIKRVTDSLEGRVMQYGNESKPILILEEVSQLLDYI